MQLQYENLVPRIQLRIVAIATIQNKLFYAKLQIVLQKTTNRITENY